MGMVGLCGTVCVALSVSHLVVIYIHLLILLYFLFGISIVSEGSMYISGMLVDRIWVIWHALFLAVSLLIWTLGCSGIGLGGGGGYQTIFRLICTGNFCIGSICSF